MENARLWVVTLLSQMSDMSFGHSDTKALRHVTQITQTRTKAGQLNPTASSRWRVNTKKALATGKTLFIFKHVGTLQPLKWLKNKRLEAIWWANARNSLHGEQEEAWRRPFFVWPSERTSDVCRTPPGTITQQWQRSTSHWSALRNNGSYLNVALRFLSLFLTQM